MTVETAPERHASWLELFFDLVAVAAIMQLAHRLHGTPTIREVGIFVGLYLAVWVAWASFTLYANISGDRTRHLTMLLAMFGIAVMAASIPDATGRRAMTFATAYIAVRVLGLITMARTKQKLFAWPSVHRAIGIVPWVVSLAMPAPQRYMLWGLGLAIDMVLPLFARRRLGNPSAAEVDLPHLAERLGLFLIIVLGEGVLQLVSAASGAEWTAELLILSTGGFVLLVGLWLPTFRFGLEPVGAGVMSLRFALPLHFLAVVNITSVAAALGLLMSHMDGHGGHVDTVTLWLITGGVSGYFLNATLGAILMWRSGIWIVYWGLPGIAAPLALAKYGQHLPATYIVWTLTLVLGWQALYVWSSRRRAARLRA